jgi:tRNA nucleotidyltransferase (CCA-adding enzyme)
MNPLLSDILRELTPDREALSNERAVIRELLAKTRRAGKKHVGAAVYGSVGRGTQLAGDRDIDLFVLFPPTMPRDEFEQAGLDVGYRVFKGHPVRKAYSEHPYLRCTYKGFEVELIPAYRVTHPRHRQSAVDRTPFHHRYLMKKLSAKQKDQVRLLKRFLKGTETYGADLAHHGFSGYATELLILKYRTFSGAVNAIARWKMPVVIDLEHRQKPAELLARYPDAPLVLIDPTDADRNVGAALNAASFGRTVSAAQAFRQKPTQQFFYPNPPKPLAPTALSQLLKQRALLALETVFDPDLHDDVFWGQFQRVAQKIANELGQRGFEVKRFECYSDTQSESFAFFELETLRLPATMERIGPPLDRVDHVQRFLDAHRGKIRKKTVKDGHIVLVVPRPDTDAHAVLRGIVLDLLKTEKEPFRALLGKKHRVLGPSDLKARYPKPTPFRDFATRFIKPKPLWKN